MVSPGRTSPKPLGFSMRNVDIFLYTLADGSASASVRTRTATSVDEPPLVSHIFAPLSTHSSPSRTALLVMADTSDPQPGSLIENAPRTSPVAMRGR